MSTDRLLDDASVENNEKICYEPSSDLDGESQDYLLYFIPGNPGLIPFYQPFLSRLHSLLVKETATEAARFHICGHSFKGFEFDNHGPHGGPPKTPLGLQKQIGLQEELLYHHIRSHRDRTGKNPKVILMGHSVGAYMLLELIRQHKTKIEDEGEEDFDLIGGILLFPTITEIAKSPLGMVASIVLDIPYLPNIIGALAKTLVAIVPSSILYRAVKTVTRFPEYAARTTTSFIKSPLGVQQALHLARDEMHVITGDKWNSEVWGAATAEGTNNRDTVNSNLTFYWGQRDKWVADNTRDTLIDSRGHLSPIQSGSQAEHWKPAMYIDNEGIPHDFCTTLRNSNTIAGKVKLWVDKIIEAHKQQMKENS